MAGEILEINGSEQSTVKRIENIMIEAGCSAGEFTFGGIALVSVFEKSEFQYILIF